jgi:raffinose/stachyose/melibiose transport system substrate-binding protein
MATGIITSVRHRAVAALITSSIALICLLIPPAHASTRPAHHSASATPIVVWDIQTGSEQKSLLQEAADFNKTHPNTPVQYQWLASNYPTKLSVAIGAHRGPDIFMGWGGGILKSYVDAGDVVDLTSALKSDPAWMNRYRPSVLANATFNGKTYAVPYNESQPEVIIYNKTIFARYHLSVPTTWPQLVQIVKTLRSHTVTPFALAGKGMWPEMMIVQYLADRIGGPAALNDISNRKPGASFNTPAWIQAATLAQNLVKMNAFQLGFAAFDYHAGADATPLLYAGRAAMMFMGVWELRIARDTAPQFAKQDMGFFAVPAVPGGKGSSRDLVGNPANYYSVTTTSKNREAAIAYLKTTLNPAYNGQLLAGGTVPAAQHLETNAITDTILLQQVHMVQDARSFQLSGDQLLPPTLAQDFLSLISSLFAQSITPQQFASQMQSKTAAYFANH